MNWDDDDDDDDLMMMTIIKLYTKIKFLPYDIRVPWGEREFLRWNI